MSENNLAEVASVIEALTAVPPTTSQKNLTRKERREQAARVERFVALPARLQEGILRYGERLQEAYKS
jgi:hypothetical protein